MLKAKALLRISHKVVTLVGKEENARPNLWGGDIMFYLGIDIGKNNHMASLLSEDGKTIFKAFSFSNTLDGGESILAKLTSHNIQMEQLEVGLEATGHY